MYGAQAASQPLRPMELYDTHNALHPLQDHRLHPQADCAHHVLRLGDDHHGVHRRGPAPRIDLMSVPGRHAWEGCLSLLQPSLVSLVMCRNARSLSALV